MQKYRVPLVLAAAFVLFGCSASPESAIEQLHDAVAKGEITKAKGYISKQVVQLMGEETLTATLAEGTEEIKKCGGLDTVKSELTGEGEVRSGDVSITYKGTTCKPAVRKVRLVKEDGQWKIVPR